MQTPVRLEPAAPSQHFTTEPLRSLFFFFYDAQGKLTPQSEAGSTLNSNLSKLLWLSLFVICKNEEDPI